jgi:hypothetical protein
MSRIKTERLHDILTEKKEKYGVRVTVYIEEMKVTTFIKGTLKTRFLDDCIKRECNESKMAGHIIDTYYSALAAIPDLKEKEPNAIKQFIIDRIKFKE